MKIKCFEKDIKEVLGNLSKEELVNIITELTQKDRTLEDSIMFKYSDCDEKEELKKCKKLTKSIAKKYTGRQGFIEYKKTHLFTNEMREILHKALSCKNKILSVEMIIIVLTEGIKTFQYSDDSGGDIGQLVSDAIGLIEEVSNSTNDESVRSKIFEKLLEISENKIFDGWDDYRIEILKICMIFINKKDNRNKLKSKIEKVIDSNADDFYSKYKNEKLLELQYYLIVDYDPEDVVEKFIKDNLEYTVFREILIGRYFDKKDYGKVIEIAIEGEKKDKYQRGLATRWKDIRYNVYKELGLKNEQEKLATELFFDGNFEYYKELKQLSKKEDFYEALKAKIKGTTPFNRYIFVKLINEENDLEEMIELARKNDYMIEEYGTKLMDKYKDEVINIYGKYIISIAQSSSNRSNYKDVCNKIKEYKKIAGKEKQEEVIEYLISSYKRRPAFIDELIKIK